MTRFVLRPRARRDLQGIWQYSVSVWGIDRADQYLRAVHHTLEMLAANPAIGRSCDEIRPGYRKHPSGSHVVFYRVSKDGIEIVRILHERMDHARHF